MKIIYDLGKNTTEKLSIEDIAFINKYVPNNNEYLADNTSYSYIRILISNDQQGNAPILDVDVRVTDKQYSTKISESSGMIRAEYISIQRIREEVQIWLQYYNYYQLINKK